MSHIHIFRGLGAVQKKAKSSRTSSGIEKCSRLGERNRRSLAARLCVVKTDDQVDDWTMASEGRIEERGARKFRAVSGQGQGVPRFGVRSDVCYVVLGLGGLAKTRQSLRVATT